MFNCRVCWISHVPCRQFPLYFIISKSCTMEIILTCTMSKGNKRKLYFSLDKHMRIFLDAASDTDIEIWAITQAHSHLYDYKKSPENYVKHIEFRIN